MIVGGLQNFYNLMYKIGFRSVLQFKIVKISFKKCYIFTTVQFD